MHAQAAPSGQESWRSLYPFQSHYADVGGPRMHYVDEGQGLPIVMLHGNPTWSFYYRRLILELRNTRRTIAPDHVGCGLSDKPQQYPYRLQQHIDNLERFIDEALQLERFVLMVHDWGGAIGAGYAVRHPQRIAGMVIFNSAAFLGGRCPWRIRICRLPVFGALAIRGGNGFARAALHMATACPEKFTRPVKAGYLAPYDNWQNRIAHLRFVQDIPLTKDHPTRATVTHIQENLHLLRQKPVLICWGDRDFCFTESFLRTWQERLPQADVHRFAHAAHYVVEDAHEHILPLLDEFLRDLE